MWCRRALRPRASLGLRGLTSATRPAFPLNCLTQDAMKKLNDKATNFCVYIICIVLLLGMVAVVYNMVIKKK